VNNPILAQAAIMSPNPQLAGRRIAFVGKLASMSRRQAQQLVREAGATCLDRADTTADWVVVGEGELPLASGQKGQVLDATVQQAAQDGALEILSETQLWQRLGMVEQQQHIHQLYTPAMLADLLGVSVAVIRRWHRRGLIRPAREVHKLPYFDFHEVATARRLAELLASGMTPQAIEKQLAELSRLLPEVQRPLAQLSVIVEGKRLLLRQGDGLIEPGGQWRFDFDAAEPSQQHANADATVLALPTRPMAEPPPASPADLIALAGQMEDEGELASAIDLLRAALAAGGPTAESCFQLAELLYRTDHSEAAIERYYMAIELDEDYVEARANLGCVLAERGEHELAAAAFEGALAFHPDYPDAHFHLARTFDELGRAGAAAEHWRIFLKLAPDSPWADEARERLDAEGE
jgi:DNA-binding transcriptional MerR regulator